MRRLIDVGAARLAVEEAGPIGAPALVLLHSSNRDRRMWDVLAPELAAEHRVVRFDARGFGESPPAAEPYSGADDVAALIGVLGLPSATLIGASFGGRVALDTAIAHPGVVDGVVMLGGRPSGSPYRLLEEERELIAAAEEAETRGDWARRAEIDVDLWIVGPTRHRSQLDAAFLSESLATASASARLLEDQPGRLCRPLDPPAVDRLHEVIAPVLCIVGAHDFGFVRGALESMSRGISTYEGLVIPNAAHFPELEQPRAVLEVLLPWLRRHER